jgi:hypothetical protein
MMEPSPTLLEERTAQTQKHKYVSLRKRETYFVMLSYLYNPGIMSVMPMAGGCFTRKNTQECLAVFVDLFHFLLLFLSFVNYFLLLKGVRFVTFCYFFYCL